MTRAEFIQRAALTLGWDAKKTQLQHIGALADAVHEVAPFDEADPQERIAEALEKLSGCVEGGRLGIEAKTKT